MDFRLEQGRISWGCKGSIDLSLSLLPRCSVGGMGVNSDPGDSADLMSSLASCVVGAQVSEEGTD